MKKTNIPSNAVPTVAQRAFELRGLNMPGATLRYSGGVLHFQVRISPGTFGRLYLCILKVRPDGQQPEMIVLKPELSALAQGKKIPHTYAYDGKGTRLCLCSPKGRDWVPRMKLIDTFIPWTAEWLYYFELWLLAGEWSGGGEHPTSTPRRRVRHAR
jgi:hypothetical protein